MRNVLRNGALALALLAGAALASAPVMAGSKHGNSGKSWNKHSYNNSYRKHNRSGRNYGHRSYRGYAYYGPGSYYGSRAYYGSPYGYRSYGYRSSPGFSITIR